jgi:hypothetical protein
MIEVVGSDMIEAFVCCSAVKMQARWVVGLAKSLDAIMQWNGAIRNTTGKAGERDVGAFAGKQGQKMRIQ